MLLEIGWGNESTTVEIRGAAGGRRLIVGDRELACDWTRLPDAGYLLLVNGAVFDLHVHVLEGRCTVDGSAGRFQLRIRDPRALVELSSPGAGSQGPRRIAAEMPGRVVRVLVQPGDSVVADQGLVVIEAMKMQNEIRAPRAGRVREVGVKAGRAVNTGDHLVTLE